MKILIIEDDENKKTQIQSFITLLIENCIISFGRSYHSGLQSLSTNPPDLILLDMTMPSFDIGLNEDGGRPQHYAGREILRQMERRNITVPVIVITMFDVFGDGPGALTRMQLDEQLRKDYPRNYFGTVYYNAASNTWKAELELLLNKVMRGNRC